MVTPPKVRPKDDLTQTVEKLITRDFSSLPVTWNNIIKGIVSRRDIIGSMLSDKDLKRTTVETIMNFAPTTFSGDTGIHKALAVMELSGKTCTAVVDDNNRFLGFVSISDLISVMQLPREKAHKGDHRGEKVHRNREVSSIMTMPGTLSRDSSIADAVKLIMKLKVSVVYVVEGGNLVGSISELDLMEVMLRGPKIGGPLIQIAGIDEVRMIDASDLNNLVMKFVKRIERFTQITAITLRIRHHHHERDEDKYTVNIKMTTPTGVIVREGYDWELLVAIGNTFLTIEKLIKKEHDRKRRR